MRYGEVGMAFGFTDFAKEVSEASDSPLSLEEMREKGRKIVLRDGDSILDVACGNGYLPGELSKKAKVNAFADECMRVLKKKGSVFMAEPFFSPVVRWIANAVVFPFSQTGDVRVYNQKELHLFFERAGFTDMESYITGTVLFFSARK